MVIHHNKPEWQEQKMGCYLQGPGHSNWVWVHTMKWFAIYMFWTVDLFVTNLVWQHMFISWSVWWKDYFAVFKVTVTVKVRNCSECLYGQYLWSNKLNMVMYHHEPEYHTEIFFCYVQGQGHNHFYYIIGNTETFTTQISLMIHHHKMG